MYSSQSNIVRLSLVLLIAFTLFSMGPAASPAAAQATIPVIILPIDRAQFLPGTQLDMRVEVQADKLPDDFDVTINGEKIDSFFGAKGTTESWEFGDEAAPTTAQSMVWRDLKAPKPGDYTVTVMAGGEKTTVTWTVREPQGGTAKNVILFIADGMTTPMITAARVMSRGNTQGKYNDYFAMDQMEEVGLVNTSGMDSIITDSANSASAYNTGHKTAVNALGVYPDSSPDSQDDPRVETFAEIVKRVRGMSVGIVTTADWTDATPAGVFAHTRRRADRPFIAAEPVDEELYPEVIMGGGARYMLPKETAGSRREDDRDMFAEYEEDNYTVVTTKAELDKAMTAKPERLLGVFHSADMNVWLDRNVYTDNLGDFSDQPGLVDMTLAALEVLNQNEKGWYLAVEAASVDKQMHPLDMDRGLADLIEYDEAIAAAIDWTSKNAPDTLIVVTADHGHGFDVYGMVDVEAFNAATDEAGKLDAIGIYENAGFPTYVDKDGDHFPDSFEVSRTLAGVVNNHGLYTEDFQVSPAPRVPTINSNPDDTTSAAIDNPEDDPNGIVMEANLPAATTVGVHTLQDVPIFASGPGAAHFGHVIDNTEVFFGMAYAIGLDPSAPNGLVAMTTK